MVKVDLVANRQYRDICVYDNAYPDPRGDHAEGGLMNTEQKDIEAGKEEEKGNVQERR